MITSQGGIKMEKQLVIIFGILVFGLFLFGCTSQPTKPSEVVNQTTTTCEEYCITQPHTQCVGAWSISGTYPNCNCSFVCEQVKEEPKINESNVSNLTTPEVPVAAMSGEVEARGFIFTPGTIEIAKSGTVTWTNKDSAQHIIVADDGKFESGTLMAGQTYTHTFNESGNYSYHCKIHTTMTGTIIVK